MPAKTEREAWFEEKKRRELEVARAKKRLQSATVDLSALEACDPPQNCIVPAVFAEYFTAALQVASLPYIDFDLIEVYGSEQQAYEAREIFKEELTEHIGRNDRGHPISPAVIRMGFTRESVFEYCKGYNDTESTEPLWSAWHEASRACEAFREMMFPPDDSRELDPAELEAITKELKELISGDGC